MSSLLNVNRLNGRANAGREANDIGETNSRSTGTWFINAARNPTRPVGEKNKPQTLEEVSRRLADHEAGVRRHPFPLSQLRVKPDRLIANDLELRLEGEGFRRICQRLGAPADYLAMLRPGLRSLVLRAHLAEGRCADRNLTDKNSCIISTGDRFLDLGRTDLCYLKASSVIQAVSEGVGEDAATLEVQELHSDEASFRLELVTPRMSDEVRVGDAVRGGLRVQHSFLDGPATKVKAYFVRLLCMNGMVQHRCIGEKSTPRSSSRTRRLPADRSDAFEMQLNQIRRMTAEIWDMLPAKLSAIRQLKTWSIAVDRALEQFLRQAHVWTRDLMRRLLAAWEAEDSEPTAFGALNALTRVATHDAGLELWQRERLFRLAGIWANQKVHLCSHCYSILKTG